MKINNITVSELKEILNITWGNDTAYKGIWDKNVPSLMQCGVTALLVQEYFGGIIIKSKLNDGSTHYYNKINNEKIDLTCEQFDYTEKYIVKDIGTSQPKLMLKNKDTKTRYEILKNRTEKLFTEYLF